MNVQIGDTVRFLNATGGGRVTRVDNARGLAYIEDEDGFEIPTLFAECVVVSSDAGEKDYTRQQLRLTSHGPSNEQMRTKAKAELPKPDLSANGKKEPRAASEMEVDLHIEAILPNRHDLPKEEILQFQLRTFRKIMQEEKRHQGKRIVFIHGKGEGVLRQQLIGILSREYPGCRFLEASMQKYSTGALMVLIG